MDFINKLNIAIAEWNKDPIEDEWLFAEFRERCVNTLTPAEAFQMIYDVVGVLLDLSDESTVIEVLQTLICLARKSDTTEVPQKLYKMKETLVEKCRGIGEYTIDTLNALYRYYRLLPGN